MHHEQNIMNLQEHITLRSMLRDFYNRNMLPIIVLTWFWVLVVLALAIYSGIKYFEAVETKDMILYAALFIIAIQFVGLMKVFGCEIISRNSINREINKLELRIDELAGKIGK